jgi:imidazolonepropionase-like amidohydrolase
VKLSLETRETLDRLFALLIKLVKPMKESGVGMLAGSDSGGSAGWTIPGFSLHQEFDLLAEAGLAPLEILQMTTINGATFLGRESRMGTVTEGKNADLVLLEANPLNNVAHMHDVSAVVRAGTYYSATDLNAMKEQTEARVANLGPPTKPLSPPCC